MDDETSKIRPTVKILISSCPLSLATNQHKEINYGLSSFIRSN